MIQYIFDGAFGTYIFTKNNELTIPELANLSHPELVTLLHTEYITAGATAIRTNTFGVNKNNFSPSQCKVLIDQAVAIANACAQPKGVSVFADLGPIDGSDAEDEYLRITQLFIDAGSKHFIFETQHQVDALAKAIAAIHTQVPDACIIVSFGVDQDGFSKSGLYITDLLKTARKLGAHYVGLNCVCGPTHLLKLLQNISYENYPLSIMPNSGYPADLNGRSGFYVDNPTYFTEKMVAIYELGGIEVVGACCGSTPMHIQAMTKALKHAAVDSTRPTLGQHTTAPSTYTMPSKFIAVEIDAPVNTNIDAILDSARQIKACGADFITVPDSPLARTRANSIMISSIIQRKVGIDVIPHLTCRDRNHIAIKGDLIAANIDEISHLLAITGDPIKCTPGQNEKSVFSFQSFQLISFIKSLNEQLFTTNPFTICGALNTSSKNFAIELKRAEKKVANGVNCLFTQPLFSEKDVENYLLARKTLPCKIAVGIMPPVSYRNAVFLNNEVPSIHIPEEVLEALKEATPEEVKAICLTYTKRIIDQIGDQYDGYYIMTQLNKVSLATDLVAYIKSK